MAQNSASTNEKFINDTAVDGKITDGDEWV